MLGGGRLSVCGVRRCGALRSLFHSSSSQQSLRDLGVDPAKLKEDLRRDGYAVVRGFADVNAVRERAMHLVKTMPASEVDESTIFVTTETKQKSTEHFLNSGARVNFFFEKNFQDVDQSDKLTAARKMVNKIGHALHDLDPEFRKFSYSPRVKSVLMDVIGYTDPIIAQSMYIFKFPFVGGEVTPHQDSTYLWTDPELTCHGLWFALDDAKLENGCMWAIPGSHIKYPIQTRFVRTVDDGGKVTTTFVSADRKKEVPRQYEFPDEEFVPLEFEKGSLVILHGGLVHRSSANTSAVPRHAYTLHVIESGRGCVWPADNWLQRSDFNKFLQVTE